MSATSQGSGVSGHPFGRRDDRIHFPDSSTIFNVIDSPTHQYQAQVQAQAHVDAPHINTNHTNSPPFTHTSSTPPKKKNEPTTSSTYGEDGGNDDGDDGGDGAELSELSKLSDLGMVFITPNSSLLWLIWCSMIGRLIAVTTPVKSPHHPSRGVIMSPPNRDAGGARTTVGGMPLLVTTMMSPPHGVVLTTPTPSRGGGSDVFAVHNVLSPLPTTSRANGSVRNNNNNDSNGRVSEISMPSSPYQLPTNLSINTMAHLNPTDFRSTRTPSRSIVGHASGAAQHNHDDDIDDDELQHSGENWTAEEEAECDQYFRDRVPTPQQGSPKQPIVLYDAATDTTPMFPASSAVPFMTLRAGTTSVSQNAGVGAATIPPVSTAISPSQQTSQHPQISLFSPPPSSSSSPSSVQSVKTPPLSSGDGAHTPPSLPSPSPIRSGKGQVFATPLPNVGGGPSLPHIDFPSFALSPSPLPMSSAAMMRHDGTSALASNMSPALFSAEMSPVVMTRASSATDKPPQPLQSPSSSSPPSSPLMSPQSQSSRGDVTSPEMMPVIYVSEASPPHHISPPAMSSGSALTSSSSSTITPSSMMMPPPARPLASPSNHLNVPGMASSSSSSPVIATSSTSTATTAPPTPVAAVAVLSPIPPRHPVRTPSRSSTRGVGIPAFSPRGSSHHTNVLTTPMITPLVPLPVGFTPISHTTTLRSPRTLDADFSAMSPIPHFPTKSSTQHELQPASTQSGGNQVEASPQVIPLSSRSMIGMSPGLSPIVSTASRTASSSISTSSSVPIQSSSSSSSSSLSARRMLPFPESPMLSPIPTNPPNPQLSTNNMVTDTKPSSSVLTTRVMNPLSSPQPQTVSSEASSPPLSSSISASSTSPSPMLLPSTSNTIAQSSSLSSSLPMPDMPPSPLRPSLASSMTSPSKTPADERHVPRAVDQIDLSDIAEGTESEHSGGHNSSRASNISRHNNGSASVPLAASTTTTTAAAVTLSPLSTSTTSSRRSTMITSVLMSNDGTLGGSRNRSFSSPDVHHHASITASVPRSNLKRRASFPLITPHSLRKSVTFALVDDTLFLSPLAQLSLHDSSLLQPLPSAFTASLSLEVSPTAHATVPTVLVPPLEPLSIPATTPTTSQSLPVSSSTLYHTPSRDRSNGNGSNGKAGNIMNRSSVDRSRVNRPNAHDTTGILDEVHITRTSMDDTINVNHDRPNGDHDVEGPDLFAAEDDNNDSGTDSDGNQYKRIRAQTNGQLDFTFDAPLFTNRAIQRPRRVTISHHRQLSGGGITDGSKKFTFQSASAPNKALLSTIVLPSVNQLPFGSPAPVAVAAATSVPSVTFAPPQPKEWFTPFVPPPSGSTPVTPFSVEGYGSPASRTSVASRRSIFSQGILFSLLTHDIYIYRMSLV
jgi:hypothetical protein